MGTKFVVDNDNVKFRFRGSSSAEATAAVRTDLRVGSSPGLNESPHFEPIHIDIGVVGESFRPATTSRRVAAATT